MRRVLLTTDAVGGVWDYSLELAAGLGRAGLEVLLAVLGPAPSPAQRAAATALPRLELHLHPGRLEWMDDPWTEVDAAGAWLLALARSRAVDLVQLGGYSHAALPFAVPRVVVAHSCVLSWWSAVRGGEAPSTWATYRARVGAGLRAAEAVVAPSAAMRDSLLLHHRCARAEVIHNGRTPGPWTQALAKAPLVLAAGRLWDEGKNLARLIEVAPTLPWPVHLAGEGPAPAAAVERGNVRLLGRLPPAALARALAEAAIYALPARYEPFGLTVLEAALSGCALVLGDIPSLRELWDGAARFVPPDQPGRLRQVLAELIVRPGERQALAERARERARHYDAETMVTRYLDLYRRLAARRPAPSLTLETACAS